MTASVDVIPGDARPMALAITTMAACALPLFFTSALALGIQRDLGLDDRHLGLSITAFWVVATVGSLPAGWLAERIGPARGVRLAGALVGAGALGIALLASSFGSFVALLGLTALGNAFVTPAISGVVAGRLRGGRRGTTFGLQQSGPPLASVVAGVALPTVGAALGWRWVFALGGVAVLAVTWTVGEAQRRTAGPRSLAGRSPGGADRRRGAVALPVLGATVASGTANGLIAYVVVFATGTGLSSATAGLLLAAASTVCVAMRVALGVLADRAPRPRLPQMGALLLAGSAGFALLAAGTPFTTVAGCLLALGVGWGWTGLYILAAVEQAIGPPERAVGVAATGTFAGAMVGPLLVGLLAGAASFTVAWMACAGLSLVGALAFLSARSRVETGVAR